MNIQHYWKQAIAAIGLASSLLFSAASANAAGLLTPKHGNLPPLSIKEHHVDVVIEDGYAITRIDQVFNNPNQQDLEAIYSFPLPEKASAAEFTMWIDGQPVTAEVLEKQKAREVYEQEKQAGRETGLTEKDSHKTFDLSVSPVRAGQDMRIRFVYIQPAHIDTGIGRYVYPLEEGGVDEVKQSFWTGNKSVEEQFSFNLQLKSGYPVEAVRLPNQDQKAVKQTQPGEWQVSLANASQQNSSTNELENIESNSETISSGAPAYTLDKDIVVYWRMAQDLPGSVDLITHKPDANGRGTFMMVVTPGDDLAVINEGIDWIFVLDISGSMQGKYATLTEGVRKGLNKMRPEDRFRIVLFNNGSHEMTSGFVHATPENINHTINEINNVRPSGGTNLYAGIRDGLQSVDSDRTSGIVLVTDGVANVGETHQKAFLKLLAKKDIRLFTFIMGNSANRPLLENLTKASNGFAQNVSNSDDIVGQILLATSKITHQALHGSKVNIKGVKTADLTPETIGSLYRGQQLVLFGHYWGDGVAQVELSGKISGQHKRYQTAFDFPAQSQSNPEIERLWAYAKIEDLMAEIEQFGANDDIKEAVVDLGIEYGLVTDYTSMLIVRDEQFEQYGIERANKKRLEKEHNAQQQRSTQAAQNRRVDQQQPMYRSSRPSIGGGGAIGHWGLLLMALVLVTMRKHKKS